MTKTKFKLQANTDTVDTDNKCLGISAWLDGDSLNSFNVNRGLHIQIRHNGDEAIFEVAIELQSRIVACVRACEGIENPAAIKELFIAAVEFQAQAYIVQGCVFGPKIEPAAIRLTQALAALGVK
jgi:hypothetical protein